MEFFSFSSSRTIIHLCVHVLVQKPEKNLASRQAFRFIYFVHVFIYFPSLRLHRGCIKVHYPRKRKSIVHFRRVQVTCNALNELYWSALGFLGVGIPGVTRASRTLLNGMMIRGTGTPRDTHCCIPLIRTEYTCSIEALRRELQCGGFIKRYLSLPLSTSRRSQIVRVPHYVILPIAIVRIMGQIA